MLVVSDTSPITNLIQVGHLNILEKLFEQIIKSLTKPVSLKPWNFQCSIFPLKTGIMKMT